LAREDPERFLHGLLRGRTGDEREDLLKESVRRYNARRREEMRAAWTSYHEGQAERHRRTLQDLIAHHEMQAAKLCKGEGS
jgi:hypothetical protein